MASEKMELREHERDKVLEPIPEEPSGKLKVGDEVSGGWLDDEWESGRFHVVRNPDGSPGSWCGEVDGTECVLREDGGGAARHDGPFILLAKHPVERWPLEDPIPPVQPDDRLDQIAQQVQAMEERLKQAEENLGCTEAMRRRLEERIAALEDEVRDLNRGLGAKRDHGHKTFVWIDEVEDELRRREDRHQVLVDRVVALEPPRRAIPTPPVSHHEDMPVLAWSKKEAFPLPVTSPLVAEQDAAGGEGPIIELWKVEQWLELFPEHNKEAREALRLIRAGQQDTRPVLGEAVADQAAWVLHFDYTGVALDRRATAEQERWVKATRAALLSTGAFREVSDGGFMSDPTPPVQLRGERLTAMEEDTKWLLEALEDPIPPVQPDDRLDQLAQQVQAIEERLVALEESEIIHGDKIGQLMSEVGLTRPVWAANDHEQAIGRAGQETLAKAQQDTRPVLTEEMKRKVAEFLWNQTGADMGRATWLAECALFSTGAFREVPDET